MGARHSIPGRRTCVGLGGDGVAYRDGRSVPRSFISHTYMEALDV
jgi:hypothetical protein